LSCIEIAGRMNKGAMKSIDLLIGVQSGCTRLALDTLSALEQEEAEQYHAAMHRLGFTGATWHISVLPNGASLLLHLTGNDPVASLTRLGNSTDEFEGWLRQRLTEISGLELNARSIHRLVQPPMARFSGREANNAEADGRGTT
jgi:hypothetical protein